MKTESMPPERLSTGLLITRAANEKTGLSISEYLRALKGKSKNA